MGIVAGRGHALGGQLGDLRPLQVLVYTSSSQFTPDFPEMVSVTVQAHLLNLQFPGEVCGCRSLTDISGRSYPCVETVAHICRCRVERLACSVLSRR